jgi:hypothetical protein
MSCRNLLITLVVFIGCSPSLAQPGPSEPSQERILQDREACHADVIRLCSTGGSTPKPGDPTVLNCLLTHKDELTEACRKNIESHVGSGGAAR